MKFVFTNIDKKTIKGKQELEGEVQPKYWYRIKGNESQIMLVKRQYKTKTIGQNAKSNTYNYYGEYFGYLLGRQAGVRVCPVDLVSVHDTKNKYSQTVKLFPASASYSVRQNGQQMSEGENILARFIETFGNDNLMQSINDENYRAGINVKPTKTTGISDSSLENNIDVIISAITYETMKYEKEQGLATSEQIARDVYDNIQDTIDMVTYDCLFGNHDRHSSNWSMIYDQNLGRVKLYSNYDNEAVLGFRKPEAEIKRIVQSGYTTEYADSQIWSRMGFGKVNSGVTAKSMLQYLVARYPEFAVSSINKITDNVTPEFVEELYNGAEGITKRSAFADELTEADEIPSEYKDFGVAMYKERREYARNLVMQYGEHARLGRNRQKVLKMELDEGKTIQ